MTNLKYKEGNNHLSSVNQKPLVHKHDKVANKCYTQILNVMISAGTLSNETQLNHSSVSHLINAYTCSTNSYIILFLALYFALIKINMEIKINKLFNVFYFSVKYIYIN